MKKADAVNTFQEGMIMDLNPLVTPNSALTNCLNGTITTFNGNENVLQNDMGNGRVETAYLPEGYVPLGTAELGGIIYVVSYNPLNNKCQIGSFPSPERNISSDEISNIVCTLSEKDFQWDENNGAYVYYLKKDLDSELIFNPGDKFIVYGHDISGNYSKFYDATKYNSEGFNVAENQTIRLDIGTITDTGKLVKFSDLKQYNLSNGQKYHIYEYQGQHQGTSKPDLDDYRSLVSQPYNIFNSKVSGRLVLIAELVQCNTFDIELSHVFSQDEKKNYIPNVIFNFGGEYPFIPNSVKCSFDLLKEGVSVTSEEFYFNTLENAKKTIDKNNMSYTVLAENILNNGSTIKSQIESLATSGYFTQKEREGNYILRYTFTPCMNWGPVSYLSVSGSVDLDKLGTGYIGLSSWRYYKQDSKISLTWGLDVYEEDGYNVTGVSMELTRFLSKNAIDTTVYTINKKASYHGVFYDILPLDQDYFRLDKKLVSNTLYLVKIKVTYTKASKEESIRNTPEERVFYRWLYTNEIFNQHYVDTVDFKDLSLTLTPDFSMNYTVKSADKESSTIYGVLNPSIEGVSDETKAQLKSSKSSLSAIQTLRDSTLNCEVSIGLSKTYDTFYLEGLKDAFSLTLSKDDLEPVTEATIKYTDREDSNQSQYLFSSAKLVDDLSKYKLQSSSGEDKSDVLIGTEEAPFPTNAVKLTSSNIAPDFKENIYSFKIQYSALQLVKAYCTKYETSLTYSGRLLPLAYDTDSFDLYNLELSGSYWKPKKFGTYSFHESGGKDGHAYVGIANSDGTVDETEVESGDNVDLNWTTDEDIASAEQSHAWSNTAIFAVHWNGGGGSRQVMYSNPYSGSDKVYSESMTEYNGKNGKTRVQLMLRSNNGNYFYPIDFSNKSRASNYSSLLSYGQNFFNDFAQILNNLYRYDAEGFSTSCLLPQSIYYMDNCTYGFGLPVSIKSTTSLKNCKVQLELEQDRVNLTDVISILQSKGVIDAVQEEIEETLKPNITYTVEGIDSTYKFNITSSDNTSGISLRNHMLDLQVTNQGIGILDYNGRDLLGGSSANYSNTKLYYITKGDTVTVKAATNVPFKRINYSKDSSGNIVVSATNTSLEVGKENLNNRFQLNDGGLLILKDPTTSELEMKRDGNNDTGKVRGFQKARLLNKYRYYS